MFKPLFTRKSICVIVLCLLVFTLLPTNAAIAGRFGVSVDDPIATSIDPANAANNASMPVLINGSGFLSTTTAALGSTSLTTTFINSTQLSAVVPWGLAPGVYDLTLTTPDQATFVLPAAYTVSLGVGKWINNGPFGGEIKDLVIQPGSPSRIYACVGEAGLFVSSDGGAIWTMLINSGFPIRIQISPLYPNVLYLNTNFDILRSLDGGASWVSIHHTNSTNPGRTLAAFPHPSQPGTVYISASPSLNNYNEGGDGELWISADYGDTVQPLANTGLTDKRISELVFDPQDDTHQTLLAGTLSGKIFLSTNGGSKWTLKADLHQEGDQYPARIDRLIYNPFGAKEPWAVKRNPFLGTDWPVLYRASSADLTTWTPVMVVDNPEGGPHPWFWMRPWSITFTASSIWAAYDTGYTSPNDGILKWSKVSQTGIPDEDWRTFEFKLFVIDPDNPNTIYAGTRSDGVFKSLDGGQTWASSNQGLAGVIPYALAVSPDNLDEVYAASQSDGVAKSTDGGRHWSLLQFYRSGMPWTQTSLVVDTHNPDVVYLGMWCPQSQPGTDFSDACVHISHNRGQTWTDVVLPQPSPANYQSGEVFAIAVDPNKAGRVLAGATFYPVNWDQNVSHPFGAFYYSDNYGATWKQSDLDPALVNGSYKIVFDAVDSNLVYAGTDGSGLWKSIDGGVSWARISWTGCDNSGQPNTSVAVHSLVTRPNTANEVIALCIVSVDQQQLPYGLFRSTDAGASWNQIQMPEGGAESLLFLPYNSGLALYAGGWGGMSRSLDNGTSWKAVEGLPAGNVYAMAGWADSDRAVVYLSTEAGVGEGTGSANAASIEPGHLAASQTVMAGGTYGLTQRILKVIAFLPFISR